MLSGRTSINAALVSEHLAVPYSGQNKEDIAQQHLINREKLDATHEEED